MKSPWIPLIAVGAGMLASRSPYPGVALGEGLETGLKVAGQQAERDTKGALAEIRAQRVEDQAKDMSARADEALRHHTETENLGTAKAEAQRQAAADRTALAGATLDIKQQAADAATLRAQTALANAKSQDEARQIQNELRKQLADITAGKGTWQPGEGPDPSDPTKRLPGMWYLPSSTSSGAEPTFHAGVTPQKAPTGEAAILHDLVQSGAAKDTADAIRLQAELKRDPHSAQNAAAIARMVETEAGRLQNSLSGMNLPQTQIEAQARRNVMSRLQAAPGAPSGAGSAPAAPAPAAAATPTTQAPAGPPAPAIAYLKAHPDQRGAFDAKYGAGSSAAVLGP